MVSLAFAVFLLCCLCEEKSSGVRVCRVLSGKNFEDKGWASKKKKQQKTKKKKNKAVVACSTAAHQRKVRKQEVK